MKVSEMGLEARVSSAPGACSNPRCTCAPCSCSECGCGVASLGEMERRVMDVLWDHPDVEMTGRRVTEALPEYAYTTVATVLDRLAHKGFILRRTEDRTIRFAAKGTRASYAAQQMHEALAVTRQPSSTLACFVETLSNSEVRSLRQALDQLDVGTPQPRRLSGAANE